MRSFFTRLQLCILLAGFLGLAAAPAYGQLFHRDRWDNTPQACPPAPLGQTPAPPPASANVPPLTPPSPGAPSVDLSSVSPEGSLALGSSTVAAESAVGYIDNAIPRTMFRLRVDSAFDDTRPDRAEFFYAKCGCFRNQGPGFDPRAAGPGTVPEGRVDFVETSAYLEAAWNNRFSGFLEVPVRFIELNDNHQDFSGISDINAGFKAALIADPCRYVTFQFRTYAPTGDSRQGLGTDHVSLEPALLAQQRLSDRLAVAAELRDWIPIGGSDFAGNVVRYGAGVSYDVYRTDSLIITPVVELVGWTALGGKELTPNGDVLNADGDTIINAKFGVRSYFGCHSDLYVGYGHALTGDVWYKEIFRLEYRLKF